MPGIAIAEELWRWKLKSGSVAANSNVSSPERVAGLTVHSIDELAVAVFNGHVSVPTSSFHASSIHVVPSYEAPISASTPVSCLSSKLET